MLAVVKCNVCCVVFFFKQKTAYDMRISDWSSDVCSSDLAAVHLRAELIITVVGQQLEITRQSVARLGLDAFGGQFARLGDDVVRQIEYTVPFLDVERSEEHTSELQSLMRISYAVFCLKKKNEKS